MKFFHSFVSHVLIVIEKIVVVKLKTGQKYTRGLAPNDINPHPIPKKICNVVLQHYYHALNMRHRTLFLFSTRNDH